MEKRCGAVRPERTDTHRRLAGALKRGAAELGAQGLLRRVTAPLAQTLGELWRAGIITAAHEHFASAVVRIVLGHAAMLAYGDSLDKIGALRMKDFSHLCSTLDDLRKPARKAA